MMFNLPAFCTLQLVGSYHPLAGCSNLGPNEAIETAERAAIHSGRAVEILNSVSMTTVATYKNGRWVRRSR